MGALPGYHSGPFEQAQAGTLTITSWRKANSLKTFMVNARPLAPFSAVARVSDRPFAIELRDIRDSLLR